MLDTVETVETHAARFVTLDNLRFDLRYDVLGKLVEAVLLREGVAIVLVHQGNLAFLLERNLFLV